MQQVGCPNKEDGKGLQTLECSLEYLGEEGGKGFDGIQLASGRQQLGVCGVENRYSLLCIPLLISQHLIHCSRHLHVKSALVSCIAS